MIGPNGTKKWSGLVGAVESGDADFAVSAMTVTPQRLVSLYNPFYKLSKVGSKKWFDFAL